MSEQPEVEYEDTTVGSLTNEEHDALASAGIIKPRKVKE